MMEEMGEENIFIFGMKVDEVEELKRNGYDANIYYNRNPELKQCLDQIRSGFFLPNKPEEFHHLVDILLKWDRFYTLADYDDYMKCQDRVNATYAVSLTKYFPSQFFIGGELQTYAIWFTIFQDQALWTRMALQNIASSGKFSSDRTISEYAREIWDVEPTWEKLPAPHEPREVTENGK